MAKNIKVALELDNKQFKKGMQQSKKQVSDFEKSGKQSFANLGTAFKALIGVAAVQQFAALGDSFTQLSNQLKAVTRSTEEYEGALKAVEDIAGRTRSDLNATGKLFSSLTIASRALGLSQAEVARVTETFSKTLKISGADAGASAGAMVQFGQALAAGTLRGDEFNSINETNSEFMQNLAKLLGVNIGELRKMAEEGRLTATVVATATEEMSKTVDEKFGKTTSTISESFVTLRNELISTFGKVEESTGVFSKISAIVLLVADNVEFLAKMFAVAFAVAVAQRVVATAVAVVQLAKAFQSAAVAGTLLQGVTGVGLVKVGAGIAAASAAIVGMNALFDDSIEGLENMGEVGDALDLDLPEKPDQDISETQKVLEEEDKITEKKKEQKKLDDEAVKNKERLLDQIVKNKAKISEILADEQASLENSMAQLELENEMIGLSEREKETLQEIADLEAERNDALASIRALQLSTDPIENLKLQGEAVDEIKAKYDEWIAKIIAQREANNTAATTFTAGWAEAFANFEENVNNSAAYAGQIFNTLTDGFTDSIMTFVETGKLSFKDLFKSLMTEIIKMQANKIFLALFGAGGAFGDFFAGLFNKGGYIPAGQFGVAGESGPEIINGPANVTSTKATAKALAGAGQEVVVNYNINAVDAQSFKQLVASDPEFIYNVTRVGQRRLPA